MKKFLLFVGNNRSGTSFLAAIISSHENAYISFEFNFLQKTYHNNNLLALINKAKKVQYPLHFQHFIDIGSKKQEILVLGDKTASKCSFQIKNNFLKNKINYLHVLDKRLKDIGYQLHFISIIRNPYDVVARKIIVRNFSPRQKINNYRIELFACELLLKNNYPIFFVKQEDFIKNPEKSIKNVFNHLGLKINNDHVKNCAKYIYKHPHKTRYEIEWKQEYLDRIKSIIQRFENVIPYLRDYSYDD